MLLVGLVAEKFMPSLKSLSALGFEGRNLGCPWNLLEPPKRPKTKKSFWLTQKWLISDCRGLPQINPKGNPQSDILAWKVSMQSEFWGVPQSVSKSKPISDLLARKLTF